MKNAYDHLSGSRAKPWDDRELDCLEGMKFFSFKLTTISQTAYCLVNTMIINMLNVFNVEEVIFTTSFMSANIAMEAFIFLSVFMTTYRVFQILEAREGKFYFSDYVKIILRKFFRLAIPYYFFWLVLWCLNSRVFNGPIWHNSNARYETCKDQWWSTAAFIGNLLPEEMYPYGDCYQQAFPLQVDMQLTLFVPLVAILAYKQGALAAVLCLVLIICNCIISMYYANKHDLVIGMLNVRNFNLLTGVIAKPWVHLQNIGFGVAMAMFYWEILQYRKV